MDIASALKPDVYRVTAIVLVPGFVAAAPWTATVFWTGLLSRDLWQTAMVPASVTVFAIVLATGFILEDLGSRLEAAWADRWLRKRAPRLMSLWWRYLSLRTDSEIVGQRYLRQTLLRYKFELSMVPAGLAGATGLVIGETLGCGLGWPRTIGVSLGLLLTSAICFRELRAGAVLLARVRRIVIRSCDLTS